jgi:hypothetical protein
MIANEVSSFRSSAVGPEQTTDLIETSSAFDSMRTSPGQLIGDHLDLSMEVVFFGS